MESDYNKKGKTTAIVAYITLIGTIIAIFMNQEPNKNLFASFHIRQAFGLWITFYILGVFVSLFTNSWLISGGFYVFIFTLILFGLISASKEEQKEVPFLGKYFQEWFTFIR